MTIERAYLDYNASAPLRPEALAVMFDIYARPGNASSVHGEGRYYRKCVEAARVQVADLVAAEPDGVIFTGSATEAAHLGLTPAISSNGAARPADKLFVLETEHPCILAGGRFEPEQVISVPVQSNGLADVDGLEEILSQHAGIIPYLAVQLANSETGIVQPVAELAKLVRLRGGYVLCDAVAGGGAHAGGYRPAWRRLPAGFRSQNWWPAGCWSPDLCPIRVGNRTGNSGRWSGNESSRRD